MKKTLALAVLGVLTLLGSAQVKAQVTNANVVLNANFAVTASVQVSDNAVRNFSINNRDIITAIGTDLGGATTNVFSRNAKLVAVIPPEGATTIVTFAIKDGGFLIDVSNFLVVTQTGTSVASTSRRGVVNDLSIQTYTLNTSTLAFDLRGATKIVASAFRDFGVIPSTITTSGAGNGTVDGQTAVVQGKVSMGGRRVDNSATP